MQCKSSAINIARRRRKSIICFSNNSDCMGEGELSNSRPLTHLGFQGLSFSLRNLSLNTIPSDQGSWGFAWFLLLLQVWYIKILWLFFVPALWSFFKMLCVIDIYFILSVLPLLNLCWLDSNNAQPVRTKWWLKNEETMDSRIRKCVAPSVATRGNRIPIKIVLGAAVWFFLKVVQIWGAFQKTSSIHRAGWGGGADLKRSQQCCVCSLIRFPSLSRLIILNIHLFTGSDTDRK